MKSANVIWTIVGVAVLLLIIGYFTNWFGIRTNGSNANKGVPTCVAECPDGKTVTYPCNEYPRCAPATSRIVVVPVTGGARNVGDAAAV